MNKQCNLHCLFFLKKNRFMKYIKVPYFFILVFFLSNNSFAQKTDATFNRQKLLEGIKDEMIRNKPIKIADALEASEKKILLKTTGSTTEKKLTTNNTTANDEGEAFIAINPNNPAQLVMSYMNESSATGLTFPIYYSNDSGNTWSKSSFNALTAVSQDHPGGFVAGGGDPIFAYDNSGKLYFSWIYLSLNGTQDTVFESMYWASSLNNGQTWTMSTSPNRFIGKSVIDPNTFNAFPGFDGFYDRQWFVIDHTNSSFSNRLYASFLYIPTPTEAQSLGGTYINTFNTTNNNWNTKKQAYTGSSQFANVAVDNNGTLHVTFADVDQNKVFHVSSSDGGQTFTAPHLIYSGVNLFGHQGSGFIQDRENSAVNLAIDGANNIHVVWSDFDNGPNMYASYYSRSTNGGLTWSTPIDIGTLLPNSLNSLMPVVSTYGNKVTIGTYAIDNSKISNYYNITSVNNGVSWDTAKIISTQQTDFSASSNLTKWFGDYFNSVRTSCKVYNIWSDGRGTTGSKMYLSVSNQCNPLGIVELTPINGSYSVKNIYPMPATDKLNILIHSNQNNKLEIGIYDLAGKLIMTESKSVNEGDNTVSVNLNSLPNSNYVLRINSEDGYKYSRNIQKLK